MYDLSEYLRPSAQPHIWCPGCGNGTVLSAMIQAVQKLGLRHEDTVVVSGIGCCSRGSGFVRFDSVNTLHGRPLPFATGIKFANPKLNVIVIAGDGDTTAIGGNHFIHAARRNIDITMIVVNNDIYGMTGGQYSPMTPTGKKTTSSVYGNLEHTFNLYDLATGAGASYFARGTVYNAKGLANMIADGISHKGFSVIEAVSQCPTAYGRRNKLKTPKSMLEWQRDHAVTMKQAEKLSPEEMEDKFLVGELFKEEREEYTEVYQELIDRLHTKEVK